MSKINQFYQKTIPNFPINNSNQKTNIYQKNNFFVNQSNYQNFYNQNNNFKIQNQISFYNYSSEALKGEYTQLKNLEHDNPNLIKERINQFEKQIILPIYQQMNKSISLKKNMYIELYNKYTKIILEILKQNSLQVILLQAYGSIMNNFLIEDGDIDISVVPNNSSIENFSMYLEEIRNEIINKKFGNCENLQINTRYSLLRVIDYKTGINIDITVHTMLPFYNTKLIRIYSLIDQRFHIMGIFIKYWIKKNHIYGAFDKFLSSYAILIMIIYFLQTQIEPKILPNLQKIENKIINYEYYHNGKKIVTNIYFEDNMDKINNYLKIINNNKENNESVGELIVKFFEFYAYKYEHDYLISINNYEKQISKEHIAFPIEDPFDYEHNPGKSMKLNTSQYDLFLNTMRKEINNILNGEYINKNI